MRNFRHRLAVVVSLPTENRYLDNPIDQSNDNFGDQLLFHTENDNDPLSSPPSKPEVPDVPDWDTEHPSHTQGNLPVSPPQWCNENTQRCGMRQQMVQSLPDSVYSNRMPINLQWDNLHRRAGNQLGSSHALPKQPTQNPIPGSSCAPPPPHQTTTDACYRTAPQPLILSLWSYQLCLSHLIKQTIYPFPSHYCLALWTIL